MIYLDYAANTPVHQEVLELFYNTNKEYIANPNATHLLGREAKSYMDALTEKIAIELGAKSSEVIYTSGASEANNLAIKGIVGAHKTKGKHIISTPLEHSSVGATLVALQQQGYEIDYLELLEDGTIDIEHLEELLRTDTILVSVCYVDSELGIRQPIEAIGKLLKKHPNCFFHTDATQAVGKIPVSFELVDCLVFAPHKFFGLNGCGVLLKKEMLQLEPLIHGGSSTTAYRSGTPALALAASTQKALELALKDLESNFKYVEGLNIKLKRALKTYKGVRINSTSASIPHILNISIKGIKADDFQSILEKHEVYLSTKSACSVANTPSRPVMALTKDRKNALESWRISLSYLVTEEEIETFLNIFDKCYKYFIK
ncbi:aminotransferase V [Sporanaerobium hydrogeniformans]|uniref:Aminotransferase V n=1 Tax=Sporanaerobium hydrogeniformans TaxID=3072179 RepID=A0AC61DEG7_9FIRM|nr:cysteine desulfurase family protein [Sporanaerobium hydrogeniformans]PHV71544.1 aminotransferase V [Sporanaerobium hydrogeniformans]